MNIDWFSSHIIVRSRIAWRTGLHRSSHVVAEGTCGAAPQLWKSSRGTRRGIALQTLGRTIRITAYLLLGSQIRYISPTYPLSGRLWSRQAERRRNPHAFCYHLQCLSREPSSVLVTPERPVQNRCVSIVVTRRVYRSASVDLVMSRADVTLGDRPSMLRWESKTTQLWTTIHTDLRRLGDLI